MMTVVLFPLPSDLFVCVCPECQAVHVVKQDDMETWLAAWGQDTENVLCPECFGVMLDQEQYDAECAAAWNLEVYLHSNPAGIEQ
jgi:hypothetical protein